MASSSQQYVDQYAEYAMEQMRVYGIPASITLAQGIIESANGKSRLALNENNHFGIKATQSWINNGGRYGLYTDDKPNEKFCSYDSVAESYEHHSRFLKETKRYAGCFALSADDYKGWAQGLDKAGYATSGQYAPSLISVIEKLDLSKYDKMVMTEMTAKGLKPGQGVSTSGAVVSSDYSFPLKRNEFMLVTSPFGLRSDPLNPKHEQMHKGIDVKCNNEALLATEKNGKVISVNENTNTPGGKSVTIQYEREDGTKMQVSYSHLSSINVKVGQTVNAGQQIGVSGNTGTRTTGPHLHFGVKQVGTDGKARDIDPAIYLADIAQKGNISLKAMHNGTDLLEKYKVENSDIVSENQNKALTDELDMSMSPEDWMKKLLSSEDSGIGMSGMNNDPVMDMVITMFTSLMALATTIDNKSEEEKMALATEAAMDQTIDLSSLVPSMKECYLTIREGSLPVLHANDGKDNLSVELTTNDMNRLNLALSDNSLDESQKQQRVSSVIGNMIVNAKMSQSYQQGMSESQEQTMQLK